MAYFGIDRLTHRFQVESTVRSPAIRPVLGEAVVLKNVVVIPKALAAKQKTAELPFAATLQGVCLARSFERRTFVGTD